MFTGMAMIAACTAYAVEQQAIQRREQREREAEAWEDANILPLLSDEKRDAFLVERRRRKERAEDIRREERQHQELVAAQRSIASAIESRRSGLLPFAAGFLLGDLVD